MESILTHSSHGYSANGVLYSVYPFLHASNTADVVQWSDSIVIVGGWDPILTKHFANRPKTQKLIFVVVDAANTIQTLKCMNASGLLERFIHSLNSNDRASIADCFYRALRPDMVIVNNPGMAVDFQKACPQCEVIAIHPPGNSRVTFNIFDGFYNADSLPRHVQNGGLPKYIVPELQKELELLDATGKIKLLAPNIEGGYLYESTLIPPEPQIVISCRRPRINVIGPYQIDYTSIERDWKPATKYANSVYSGSNYIGTYEGSVQYLSEADPCTSIVRDIPSAIHVLTHLCDQPCSIRRAEATRRFKRLMQTSLNPYIYARKLYEACSSV
jgi:hypothetical protein